MIEVEGVTPTAKIVDPGCPRRQVRHTMLVSMWGSYEVQSQIIKNFAHPPKNLGGEVGCTPNLQKGDMHVNTVWKFHKDWPIQTWVTHQRNSKTIQWSRKWNGELWPTKFDIFDQP